MRRCTGIGYTINALEELMESGSLRRFGLVASAVPPTTRLGSLDFATISDRAQILSVIELKYYQLFSANTADVYGYFS